MYRDLEMQLRGLDSEAWPFLKQEIIPLLTIKDPKRGWTQLFNRLNQANAYNYLASIGCTDIKFIPCAKDRKTPDLQAQLLSRKVLCEVKTINISEDEAEARTFYKVRNIELSLNDKFFNKLRSDLDQAKSQMADYCLDVNAKRVVYIIINFDDLLHEYADNYSAQINQYIANNPISNLEVVLDIKPPFYVASA